MKTSKIIFITMLSTIALLMLAGAVYLHITGRMSNKFQVDFKVIKKTISPFKVLCINDSRRFELIQSDSSIISVFFMKDSVAPDLKYTLIGDTLKFSDQRSEKSILFIKIHVIVPLKRIIAKNSTVNLTHFNQANLSLDLDHSRLEIYQIKDQKKTFQLLNIVARNKSNIHVNNLGIDTLKIDLQKSDARIMSNLNTIYGNLTDGSRIWLRQANQISLQKDASSKIQTTN